MKNGKKIIVGAASIFLGMNIVNAASNACGIDFDFITPSSGGFGHDSGLNMDYTVTRDNSDNLNYYTIENSETGEKYMAWCRNAGHSNGQPASGGSVKFSCDDSITLGQSDNDDLNKFYAGIMDIVKNGYQPDELDGDKLSKDDAEKYAATELAMRAYEMFWGDTATNGYTDQVHNVFTIKMAQKLVEDPELQKLMKDAGANPLDILDGYVKWDNGKKVQDVTDTGFIYGEGDTGIDITNGVLEKALGLLKSALSYASSWEEEYASLTSDYKQTKGMPTFKDDATIYKITDEFTLNAKNFHKDSKIIIKSFNCEQCKNDNVKVKFFVQGKEVADLTDINLLEDMPGDKFTGTLSIKIEFEITIKAGEPCDDIKYDIAIDYEDETINSKLYSVTPSSSACGTSKTKACQRFFIPGEGDANLKLEGEVVGLCSNACEDLEKRCAADGKGSLACQKFENDFGGSCSTCDAYVGGASCSTDSTFSMKEGYQMKDACTEPTEEDLDVKHCVIKHDDVNGNSYEAGYVSNDFCTTWCREEYEFTMPGDQDTTSDRYFTLKAGIKGKKFCYTSKIQIGDYTNPLSEENKENNTFAYQWELVREDTIKWYNYYQFYDAAIRAYNSYTYLSDVRYEQSGEFIRKGDRYYLCDEGVTCPDKDYYAGDYYGYKYEWDVYGIYDPTWRSDGNTAVPSTDPSLLPSESHVSCSAERDHIHCVYDDPGYSGYIGYINPRSGIVTYMDEAEDGDPLDYSAYVNARENAENSLENAVKKYEQLVKDVNDCAKWQMGFTFNPVLEFDYEETYMYDAKFNMLTSQTSGGVGGVTVQRCTEEVADNAYKECSVGWIGGSATTDPTLKDRTRFICTDVNKCESVTRKVTQTVSMKEEQEASGQYITPTQFYQLAVDAQIVVSESPVADAEALENSLPVALKTKRGQYRYAIRVKDLGEFYDRGSLGRFWGADESLVTYSLNGDSCQGSIVESEHVNKYDFNNGVYVCHYNVNIPTDPGCPDCPVECDPSDPYSCERPACDDCPVRCEYCIYDEDLNVSYRPVTDDNINPNDRDLGFNWDYDHNPGDPLTNVNIKTSLELKAYATTKELLEMGEDIYDITFDSEFDPSSEFTAMEVTMDSQLMSKIREMNKSHSSYADNTLTCYDHIGTDGTTYKFIYCYSTFIDELLYDSSSSSKIKIKGNRILGSNATDTNNLRRAQTQGSGYWTTWDNVEASTYSKWTTNLSTSQIINYLTDFSNSSSGALEYGIGPSWK